MRIFLGLMIAGVGTVVACGGDERCDPTAGACTFAKDVSTMTVPAGHEDENTCQSWTLNNPTELWVHEIAQTNGGAYTLSINAADANGATIPVSTNITGTASAVQQVNGTTMVTVNGVQVPLNSVTGVN